MASSFFQRLLGVFKPTAMAQTVLRSTPDPENPYPRGGGRKVALGQGQGTGLRQLPVYTWTEWDTVDKVKAALTNLEAGHFLQAAQLVDAMGRDDRISGVLRVRVNSLFGLPVDYDEDEGDKKAGEALKDLRPKMFPKAQAKKLLRSGIMLGVGLARNVWERTETSWTPRLEWWHPQFIQWRWDTRSFWVQTMSGQVEVKQGDPDWVLYTPSGEHLGWLEGTVRSLAIPWLIRQWARRDWARYSEVHGLPIRKGIVPAKGSDEDKERFIYELSQLGTENTIRLPQGSEDGSKFDVDLLEASTLSWEGFQALIQKTDADIAVTVLGQNLTTEISKGDGSRAAAQVHDSIRQDVLEDDGSSLDDCLHEQVVQPWALYNYGDADAAPMARTHTEPPEDLKGTAETFKSVADALNGFKALRVPVNVEQVCSDFGVPVEEDGEFPDLTEEPEPATDPNAQDPNVAPANQPAPSQK